jgi:hypothetical protein
MGILLSVATVWAVSVFDARTWPALTLDPAWGGPLSESNQLYFVCIYLAAIGLLGISGVLWGRLFHHLFGPSALAKIALIGGVLSSGGFFLNGAGWRLTMWLEDMGYYIVHPNDFNLMFVYSSLGVWILGGLIFTVFSVLAASKFGKR